MRIKQKYQFEFILMSENYATYCECIQQIQNIK